MEQLYREIILDNYRDSSNKRSIEGAISQEGFNPSCGDDIILYMKIKENVIEDISYEGHGCSICMASANILCKALKNKHCEECSILANKVRQFVVERKEIEFSEDEEEIESLIGIQKLPARTKCAMLSWNTLEQIIKEIKHEYVD